MRQEFRPVWSDWFHDLNTAYFFLHENLKEGDDTCFQIAELKKTCFTNDMVKSQ